MEPTDRAIFLCSDVEHAEEHSYKPVTADYPDAEAVQAAHQDYLTFKLPPMRKISYKRKSFAFVPWHEITTSAVFEEDDVMEEIKRVRRSDEEPAATVKSAWDDFNRIPLKTNTVKFLAYYKNTHESRTITSVADIGPKVFIQRLENYLKI